MSRRAAVFAHFDRDMIVDEYVIYYLKELQKVMETLVFVSDSDLSETELSKVRSLGITCIAERHEEYDFGSYKRGFFALQNRDQYDEIVFCNDSCYGPLFPFSELFAEMDARTCDFWGLTQNNGGITLDTMETIQFPHVQSYFLAFRKQVFTSEIFVTFMNSIKKEEDKLQIIINYEMGVSKILSDFKSETYVPANESMDNPTHSEWKSIVTDNRFPLLKVDLIRDNTPNVNMFSWKKLVANTSYESSLILNHVKRVQNRQSFKMLYRSSRRHLGVFHPTTLYWFIKKVTRKKD